MEERMIPLLWQMVPVLRVLQFIFDSLASVLEGHDVLHFRVPVFFPVRKEPIILMSILFGLKILT